jgi:hypothetical protein
MPQLVQQAVDEGEPVCGGAVVLSVSPTAKDQWFSDQAAEPVRSRSFFETYATTPRAPL